MSQLSDRSVLQLHVTAQFYLENRRKIHILEAWVHADQKGKRREQKRARKSNTERELEREREGGERESYRETKREQEWERVKQRARDTERERETERGEREGGREREGVRGRGRICTHVRETALDLWLLFLCFFLPLGLPFVNWASQSCCLFYLRSSLRFLDLPLFCFHELFPSLSFSHLHSGLLFPILPNTWKPMHTQPGKERFPTFFED